MLKSFACFGEKQNPASCQQLSAAHTQPASTLLMRHGKWQLGYAPTLSQGAKRLTMDSHQREVIGWAIRCPMSTAAVTHQMRIKQPTQPSTMHNALVQAGMTKTMVRNATMQCVQCAQFDGCEQIYILKVQETHDACLACCSQQVCVPSMCAQHVQTSTLFSEGSCLASPVRSETHMCTIFSGTTLFLNSSAMRRMLPSVRILAVLATASFCSSGTNSIA